MTNFLSSIERETRRRRRFANRFIWEWYSNRNGRVVIQSTRLAVERIGDRAFELTEAEWIEQAKQDNEQIGYFMTELTDALGQTDTDQNDEDE